MYVLFDETHCSHTHSYTIRALGYHIDFLLYSSYLNNPMSERIITHMECEERQAGRLILPKNLQIRIRPALQKRSNCMPEVT